jgi:hypothetical protein
LHLSRVPPCSGRPSVLPAAFPGCASDDSLLAGPYWDVLDDVLGADCQAAASFPVEGLLSLASASVADLAGAGPLVPHVALIVGLSVPGRGRSTRVEFGSGITASAGLTDLAALTFAALVLDRHLSTLSERDFLAATIFTALIFSVFSASHDLCGKSG